MQMRHKIQEALAEALEKASIAIAPQEVPLEFPADLSHGDYATGVALKYAKQVGMNPRAFAEKIVTELGDVDDVSKIDIAGPGFINFHIAYSTFLDVVRHAAVVSEWGMNKDLAGKKIMVEYTDPNPFKEFHIGHLMSNAIGESISRLMQFSEGEVKRANYQGDVGPHVAKAIWGMQKLGLVPGTGTYIKTIAAAYAEGARQYEVDPQVKKEIDDINQKIYDKSDREINALYNVGRTNSLDHFEKLYRILGTKFDFYFFESETAPKGLGLVKTHPEIFVESNGAVVYKGEQDGLHTRVFITSKGLPTYETKELGLAVLKNEKCPSDVLITITAHEQSDYFAVVLSAMRKVLPEIAEKIRHITHGMMRLATGKMSSRTGDVITGESLLNDLTEQAKIRAAESRTENHEQLAQDVAVAAIKYQILKQAAGKDITFDRERALSLEGDSGPYLQYAYARTLSLLEKAQGAKRVPWVKADADEDFQEVAGVYKIMRLLMRFPDVIERASKELEPHYVATYLIELASVFSSWYGTERIIVNNKILEDRVILIEAVARTLKNGLWVLGIPAPEKM